MSYTTEAIIDLKALTHNLQQVKKLAPNSKIIAMVKANAYGHGLLPVARALGQADALGVARLNEALALRQAGIFQKIVLMEGFNEASDLVVLQKQQLETVVHHFEQIDLLEAYPEPNAVSVWLKINTGMCRLGIAADKLSEAIARLQACPAVQKIGVLLSHFAEAENADSEFTLQQMAIFDDITLNHNIAQSLANSAAIFAYPDSHRDWVRPGLMLYGVSPFADKTGAELDLKPVMTLQGRLIAIQDFSKGNKIGYNGTFTCPEDMKIGIVSTGYGDGYPRYITDNTPVIFQNKQTRILGRVSMDMIAIDLQDFPLAKSGERVIFWGEDLPIEIIAKQANTSPYELLCGLSSRVLYKYTQ